MSALPLLAAAVFSSLMPTGNLGAQEPAPSPKKEAAKSAVQEKAEKLMIDRVRFEDTDIRDALEHIRVKAVRADEPDQSGVNALFHVSNGWKPAEITMDLRNLSVWDALQTVTKAANLRITIAAETILLHDGAITPRARKAAGVTEAPAWKSLTGLKIDRVSFAEADLPDVCTHYRKKAAEAGKILNLICTPEKSPPVTLDMRGAAMTDILEITAELAGQEITACGGILVLRPPAAPPAKPENGASPKAAPEWMKSAPWKRAEGIIFDDIAFIDADTAEVAEHLTKKSQASDKTGKGVAISLDGLARPSVTLVLREAKLSDIMLALAEANEMEISVEKDTIGLINRKAEKVGRKNAESIIIPKLEFRGWDLNDCLDLLVHACVQPRPGSDVPSGITVINRMKGDHKITLKLENISAWDALQKVAAAAGGKLEMDGYRLVIAPKR